MFERIAQWFIKRDLKRRHIHVDPNDNTQAAEFNRVLNTLRENKVIVEVRQYGIYIRLGGDINKGETFSNQFVKIK